MRAAQGAALAGALLRLAPGGDGVTQQHAFGIQCTQLEIGLRHVSLQGQNGVPIQGRLRIRIQPERGLAVAQTLEQIDLVRDTDARAVQWRRATAGGFGLHRIRADIDGGRTIAVGTHRRPGLIDTGTGGFQGLVRGQGLAFKIIQRRIAEHHPPRAAIFGFARRRLRPAHVAGRWRLGLEGRRQREIGRRYGRGQTAPGEQQEQREGFTHGASLCL